jgi:hypothetical protein
VREELRNWELCLLEKEDGYIVAKIIKIIELVSIFILKTQIKYLFYGPGLGDPREDCF